MASITLVDRESRDRIYAWMLLAANIEVIRGLDEEDGYLLMIEIPGISPLLH